MISRFIRFLSRKRQSVATAVTRFSHRFAIVIAPVGSVLQWLAVAAAVTFMVTMIIFAGFEHHSYDHMLIRRLIRACQITFLTNLIFHLVLMTRSYTRSRRWLQHAVDVLLLLTLLPLLYPHPRHPWIPWLEQLAYAPLTIYVILTLYSLVQLCYAVMRIPGKRTNPSLLLTVSFLLLIVIGALLLMLPRCTVHGISFIDSLFVSTSAVCITGLTPVDISSTFTPLGITVLAILIETGALGVMTFTCFFAMFFTGNQSIYSQLLMRDVIYSKSMNSLIPTLLYVLAFAVTIEAAGAICLYFTIPDSLMMDTHDKIIFSVFHSISAFCNAGFSNLRDGLSNPALINGDQTIYWTVSLIIISGAIGFPILVNFKDAMAIRIGNTIRRITRRGNIRHICHLYDTNTKVVLATFGILLAFAAIAFYFLESGNSLYGMTQWQRISQSVFNAVTPRSAGFSSVNPAGFLNVTLVMIMFLMWVGGGAQSTAGGVKVNTLAAICINMRSIVTGREQATAFHRTIAVASIRRANAIVATSILTFLLYSLTMLLLEPELPARDVLFETLSALFTVGSSLGITHHLGPEAKAVLCTAMLFGRVGLISLMTGLTGTSRKALVRYPTDNLIIN